MSSIPDRTNRETSAMVKALRVTTGNIRCCQVPVPDVGNQFSFMEKNKTNMRPSQKTGTDWTMTARPMATKSASRPSFTAAMMPSGIPIPKDRISETPASRAVRGKCNQMISATGF